MCPTLRSWGPPQVTLCTVQSVWPRGSPRLPVGSNNPQVALLLLRQCRSFCRLVHLSRNTPPSLVKKAFVLFDVCVQRCFSECTTVDAADSTRQQLYGGVWLRHHSPAAYIALFQSSGLSPLSGKYLICPLHNSFVNPRILSPLSQ